jgi:predicted Zn-dependent protease with MMP-like domain
MVKRRRGSRSARLPRRPVGHRPFDDLVDAALATIPMPFAAALDEVAIVIADEPTQDQLAEGDVPGDDGLYGLYEGVPRTDWGADWIVEPNRITLFRIPLETDFPDPDDLADEVWITVIHELAHHLGIDDDRLHELGVD